MRYVGLTPIDSAADSKLAEHGERTAAGGIWNANAAYDYVRTLTSDQRELLRAALIEMDWDQMSQQATPGDLSRELNVSPKKIRDYLRSKYGKLPPLVARWHLTSAQAADVRAHFGKRGWHQ